MRNLRRWTLILSFLCLPGVVWPQQRLSHPKTTSSTAEFGKLSKQADAARQANRADEAIALYQKALKLNPRWDEGWWYLGTLYYDSDRYADGVTTFRNLVELDPQYGAAWAMLGLCEFETRDYQNALIHLERARAKGLGDNQELVHAARYHQALIEILQGNFEDANSLLSSLVVENVLSNDVKLGLGLALLHVPLLPNQIDPSKDALVAAAGHIGELEALQDFDEARKAFDQLLHDYPDTPFVHYACGAMLAQLSQYNEAERELEQEIKVNPDSSIPYMQLAYIYVRLSRFADALPLAQKAVEIVPDSFAAHYLLGRALLGMGRVNESIVQLTTAKRLGPYSPEVRYNLAQALARAKRTREAAVEQAEFRRLNALVQQAEKRSPSQSYRNSSDRAEMAPHQVQQPGAGPPQL